MRYVIFGSIIATLALPVYAADNTSTEQMGSTSHPAQMAKKKHRSNCKNDAGINE